VLIAVAVTTTVVSWLIGFERNATGRIDNVVDAEARTLLAEHARTALRIDELNGRIGTKAAELKKLQKEHGELGHETATLNYEIELLKLQLQDRENENRGRNRAIRSIVFERVPGADGQPDRLYAEGRVPQGEQSDGRRWRIARAGRDEFRLVGGGEVVGKRAGGAAFVRPAEDLLGHDRQPAVRRHRHFAGRLHGGDLHRQGHGRQDQAEDRPEPGTDRPGPGQPRRRATQSFPVSGSFSRSAVNINAGAITGMSSVFTGLFVLLTLLFLTPCSTTCRRRCWRR
jgi:SulP family sulfate permease